MKITTQKPKIGLCFGYSDIFKNDVYLTDMSIQLAVDLLNEKYPNCFKISDEDGDGWPIAFDEKGTVLITNNLRASELLDMEFGDALNDAELIVKLWNEKQEKEALKNQLNLF